MHSGPCVSTGGTKVSFSAIVPGVLLPAVKVVLSDEPGTIGVEIAVLKDSSLTQALQLQQLVYNFLDTVNKQCVALVSI